MTRLKKWSKVGIGTLNGEPYYLKMQHDVLNDVVFGVMSNFKCGFDVT